MGIVQGGEKGQDFTIVHSLTIAALHVYNISMRCKIVTMVVVYSIVTSILAQLR